MYVCVSVCERVEDYVCESMRVGLVCVVICVHFLAFIYFVYEFVCACVGMQLVLLCVRYGSVNGKKNEPNNK